MPFIPENNDAKLVGIYGDRGAGAASFLQTRSMWKEAFPSDIQKRIKKDSLVDFLNYGDVLILPGGRDVFYHSDIDASICGAIRQFVKQGGVYIGICAGAYFATSFVDFDAGAPYQVNGKRHLGFWPGTAFGPVYQCKEYHIGHEQGACLLCIQREDMPRGARSTTIDAEGELVYYFGGCTFLLDPNTPESCNTCVIARYWDSYDRYAEQRLTNAYLAQGDMTSANIAAIKQTIGKGQVYLFGYHPEFRSKYMSPKNSCPKLIASMQTQIDPKSVRSFRSYFVDLH